jgi:hypothetical protein
MDDKACADLKMADDLGDPDAASYMKELCK